MADTMYSNDVPLPPQSTKALEKGKKEMFNSKEIPIRIRVSCDQSNI